MRFNQFNKNYQRHGLMTIYWSTPVGNVYRISWVVIAAWLSGCAGLGGFVQEVQNTTTVLEPDPVSWNSGEPLYAAATVRQNDGEPIAESLNVLVSLEWVIQPGQSTTTEHIEANRDVDDPTRYHVTADADLVRSAQLIDVLWRVENSSGSALTDINAERIQVDCPDGPEPFLTQMQSEVMGMFDDPANVTIDQINAEGYKLNNHGFAHIAGSGVSFVRVVPNFTVSKPPILLFTASHESANIADTESDEPYRLIGWGYAGVAIPGDPLGALNINTRPTFNCIPFHEWFYHEAGWHTPDDGGMVLDPPPHSLPTDMPDEAIEKGALPHFYHPRIWDVHVWADPSGVPRLSLLNTDADGNKVPSGGFQAPDAMFFYPPM